MIMEELKILKEKQKILFNAKILDLKAINEVNAKLYQIRQARARERAKERAKTQEQKTVKRINAIFER